MKKIILTLAGSLLIGLAAINAQQQSDTTGTQGDKRESHPSTEYRQDDQSRMQWRNEDREIVTSDRLPSPLLQTLNSDQYRGWENATIYRNRQTDEYMLIISDGSEPRTFYFDNSGKLLDDQSGTTTGGTGTESDTTLQSSTSEQSSTSGVFQVRQT
jgi:hypothetical protein